jgi:hypothetical protein
MSFTPRRPLFLRKLWTCWIRGKHRFVTIDEAAGIVLRRKCLWCDLEKWW